MRYLIPAAIVLIIMALIHAHTALVRDVAYCDLRESQEQVQVAVISLQNRADLLSERVWETERFLIEARDALRGKRRGK